MEANSLALCPRKKAKALWKVYSAATVGSVDGLNSAGEDQKAALTLISFRLKTSKKVSTKKEG